MRAMSIPEDAAATPGTAQQRTPVLAGQPASLRSLGYDERWLQDWLAADPSRLGLGNVRIVDQEQGQAGAGLLDLLALDVEADTYYSVEVQLGEIDASHSFRVFDYWARNRARIPGKTHVAVLMAENAAGRFRMALEALAETVPMIVIELRCWQGRGEALLIPEIVIANESLDLADTPAAASAEERTEDDWRAAVTDTMWAFKDAFVAWAREHLGDPRVDYRPQSYIGHPIRPAGLGAAVATQGRRLCLPARPRWLEGPAVASVRVVRDTAARRRSHRVVEHQVQRGRESNRDPTEHRRSRAATRTGVASCKPCGVARRSPPVLRADDSQRSGDRARVAVRRRTPRRAF
jgi:hypothetical protein